MSFMRSPAFQFYPSNYLGSRAVRLMDAEQRGWYTQLLFESWESEPQATLPNDDALLRVLAGVNTCSADVEQRWAFVKSQFKQKGKLIYNSRLLEEFAKQDEFREKRRLAGQASGEARRTSREAVKNQHLSENGTRNTRSTPVPFCSDSVRTKDEQKRTLRSPSLSPTQSQDPILEEKRSRPQKTRDARLDHPAIQAVFKIKGKYPSKDVWDLIIETIGGEPDAERLRGCWVKWRGKGFNSENYGWMTDWYISGTQGSNGAAPKSKVECSIDATQRFIQRKEAEIAARDGN